MRNYLAAATLLAGLCGATAGFAQTVLPLPAPMERAPTGAVPIPLYGAKNPGSPSTEIQGLFAGSQPVSRNVTYPTLTPVLPDPAKANGTAVIVAPGGGFLMLSLENEGWRVARALADQGVAAFVLKYRVTPTEKSDAEFMTAFAKRMAEVKDPTAPPVIYDPAISDGIQALKLVRSRATEWRIDPGRVGMIGFSAGAMTALGSVLKAGGDEDPATRAPDFIGFIYGPMTPVAVPADAPPMFAALAVDDELFGNAEFGIIKGWRAARRPVELHMYQTGGHGFGLGQTGNTTALLMPEFLGWMEMQGLLKSKETK